MSENWETNWKDYYQILQVHPAAEQEVIKAAYDILVRKYHPDVNQDPIANERIKDINEAFEILGSPEKKRRYYATWLQNSSNNDTSPRPSPPASSKVDNTETASDYSPNRSHRSVSTKWGIVIINIISIVIVGTMLIVFLSSPTNNSPVLTQTLTTTPEASITTDTPTTPTETPTTPTETPTIPTETPTTPTETPSTSEVKEPFEIIGWRLIDKQQKSYIQFEVSANEQVQLSLVKTDGEQIPNSSVSIDAEFTGFVELPMTTGELETPIAGEYSLLVTDSAGNLIDSYQLPPFAGAKLSINGIRLIRDSGSCYIRIDVRNDGDLPCYVSNYNVFITPEVRTLANLRQGAVFPGECSVLSCKIVSSGFFDDELSLKLTVKSTLEDATKTIMATTTTEVPWIFGQIYENKSLGISIETPTGWSIKEENKRLTITPDIDPRRETSLTVSAMGVYSDVNQVALDYVNNFLTNINCDIISDVATIFNCIHGREITYSWHNPLSGEWDRCSIKIFVHRGLAWGIEVKAMESLFSIYNVPFSSMVQSFRFLPNQPALLTQPEVREEQTTYTNTEYNFSLHYPTTWAIKPAPLETNVVFRADTNEPNFLPAVRVIVLDQSAGADLKAVFTAHLITDGGKTIDTFTSSEVTINGTKFTEAEVTYPGSFGKYDSLIIGLVKNGKWIIFEVYTLQGYFPFSSPMQKADIINTVKFQ